MRGFAVRILGAWLLSAVLLLSNCINCLAAPASSADHGCCKHQKNTKKQDGSKPCAPDQLLLETAKAKPAAKPALFAAAVTAAPLAPAAGEAIEAESWLARSSPPCLYLSHLNLRI